MKTVWLDVRYPEQGVAREQLLPLKIFGLSR